MWTVRFSMKILFYEVNSNEFTGKEFSFPEILGLPLVLLELRLVHTSSNGADHDYDPCTSSKVMHSTSLLISLSILRQAFSLAMAVGLYTVRYQRKKAGLPRSDFRAWDIAIVFNILVNIYSLAMPGTPPLVALTLESSASGTQLTLSPPLGM